MTATLILPRCCSCCPTKTLCKNMLLACAHRPLLWSTRSAAQPTTTPRPTCCPSSTAACALLMERQSSTWAWTRACTTAAGTFGHECVRSGRLHAHVHLHMYVGMHTQACMLLLQSRSCVVLHIWCCEVVVCDWQQLCGFADDGCRAADGRPRCTAQPRVVQLMVSRLQQV